MKKAKIVCVGKMEQQIIISDNAAIGGANTELFIETEFLYFREHPLPIDRLAREEKKYSRMFLVEFLDFQGKG